MNPKLSVEIGADVKGLEAALKRADNLLKQHEGNYKRVQAAIGQNTQKTLQLEKSISQLNNEFKKGNISQAQFSKESDRLTAELQGVNNETADFQKELRRLDGEMDRVAASTANYSKAAAQTEAATGRVNNSMNSLGRTTRVNATPALMGFSQIVQDAPYGIRGVANNITFLTEQFSYLSKSTGGAKGALKAMVSSLMGPAGIMLAVSLVTSLLVAFSDKLFASGEAAKTADEKLNDYVDSLKGVNKAQLDAGVSAQKELVQLRLLAAQATNTALATNERKAAVEELRRLYPSYLKGMSDEQIMANGLTTAYNQVTDSIMRKAKAQAASNLMVKNLEKERTLSTQLAAKKLELEKANAALPMSLEEYEKATKNSNARHNDAIALYEDEADKIRELRKEVNDLTGAIQSSQLENISLKQDIDASGALTVSPTETVIKEGGKGSKSNPVKVAVKFDYDAENLLTPEEVAALEQEINNDLALGNAKADASLKAGYSRAEDMFYLGEATDETTTALEDQMKVANQLQGAFGSMTNTLINGLVDGKMKAEDLGKTLLKTVLGIGLNVLSGGIAGGLTKLLGFSGGGIAQPAGFTNGGIVGGSSFSGDKLWARINSGEMVLNKDQQKSVYSQLQAPTVMANPTATALDLNLTSLIEGDHIRLVLDRADRNKGRVS